MAPTAGIVVDPSRLDLPLVAFEHPGVRLQAMVTAADAAALASATLATSALRVGPNIQITTNRQPQNEIAAAANPLDGRNVMVGSNDYRLRDEGASVWVGVYTTKDGGRTWAEQLLPGHPRDTRRTVLSTFQFGGDPILAFDGLGRAYAGGIFFRGTPFGADIRDVSIAVARSDDGGVTWNDPVIVALGKAQSVFHDHPQMTADAFGNAFVSWTLFRGFSAPEIWVATSHDGGLTWRLQRVSVPVPPGDAAGFYQDSMVATGPAGEAYVVWDETFLTMAGIPAVKIWMTVSRDGGETFAAPWVIEDAVVPIALPNAPYRHDSYPVFAADTSSGAHRGRLYLTWSDQRSGNADILLKSSDDGGATWSTSIRVNDDAGTAGQFMQWAAVGPDGRVDVAFYDRRDDPDDYLLNEYVARSTDGGASFVNVRVSDVSSDPAVWSAFIGDYNQIAATARASYPAWSDFRNGVPGDRNQDAYTAAVFA